MSAPNALDALQFLDPGMPREQWVKVAFAAKDAEISEDDFVAWSSTAANFNEADARTTYKNAKPRAGGVTAASLFMWARDAGYNPETKKPNGGNGAATVAPIKGPKKPREPEPEPTDPVPIWNGCRPVELHGYLKRKGIKPHGARVSAANWLVIPYVNREGELQTVQMIAADGTKRFLAGARQKGSVAFVGDPRAAPVVVVAEGFATAAAIHESTGLAALAAGSRGQLVEAARIARHFAPDGRVVIAADRGDLSAPMAAARAVAGFLAVPGPEDSGDGFDFCDWRGEGASDLEIRARIDRAPAVANPDPPPQKAGLTVAIAPRTQAAPPVGYRLDERGRIVPNLLNLWAWLKTGDVGDFRADLFTGLRTWDGQPVDDAAFRRLTCLVQAAVIDNRSPFQKVTVASVIDAALGMCEAHTFNSCIEWLDALPAWDGTERIARFFVDVAGLDATDYTVGVGRYFWLGLVSRMVRPGTQVDAAVALVGPQGIGKTSLARIVGGERYGDIGLAHVGERDWCMQLRGKILVEIAELSGHSRAELESIKAILTRTVDDYREPYARTTTTVARGCVFMATTNERDFLLDSSGNRRWLPVDCPHALALDMVQANRGQLFAEAYASVKAGLPAQWYRVPDSAEAQGRHVATDPWVDLLEERLASEANGGALPDAIAVTAIYEALRIPAERQTGGGTGRRLAAVMGRLGYARSKWYTGDRQVRGYQRVATTLQDSSGDVATASK